MSYRLGVIMDPIDSICPAKDSTLAMLLEAQVRGYELHYMEQHDVSIREGVSYGTSRTLSVSDDNKDWFELGDTRTRPLHELNVILMRKDPPFDMEYVYTTYALELAEKNGSLVINKPQSLRDVNEKLFISWFPQCCATTLICRDRQQLRDFIDEQKNVVVKPLDGMGGESVFRTAIDDPNKSVIIDTITHNGKRSVMAQRYIAEISAGDKRILVIDGEPIPYALARIPAAGESRGNLAAGGTGKGVELSERDRWICQQVGPELRQRGLVFVGLDVIGDYLTEVNVTSPTCIRQLDSIYNLNISATLFDAIERKLA
ncbi:MAG: glutathione synthase [Gammaproteobacteria bacterium]|nr:glutathione synthase [Gammaproteobacteria bacterium]PCH63852.1 MAG: glutathione synthase [Gammaproteobacteria bacterium]